ncbi:MAG TPA: zinc-binding dehydrogenase [Candidatus Dormibacteraeota bacterium]|jgi:L-iditol 2-dehydrogenase
MTAARIVAPGRIEVGRFPVPPLMPGEVLIGTRLAAICGSDLHIVYRGHGPGEFPGPPGYPGHESVGEVLESRSDRYRPGDVVLALPAGPAGRSFAERQAVSEEQLVPLAAGADLEAMLMAQQLGTAIFSLKRFWPGPPGETATVIGAGAAGLHFTQLLARAGFGRVIVADRHPHRLAAARALGAAATVLAPGESVVEATLDLTGGRGADLVVEAAGRDASRAQAMLAVADGGRVGLFGLPEGPGDMALPFAELFRRRPTIDISVGAQGEPGLVSFREAVDRIAAGAVNVSGLVSHRFDIGELTGAFEIARDPGDAAALKVTVGFSSA